MNIETNNKVSTNFKNLFYKREFQIGLLIVVLSIVLSLVSPFLKFGNISAILINGSTETIVALGMTILLISGGFDLSVGSVFALGGITAAMAIQGGVSVILAIIIGLCSGLLVGIINGIIITKIGVNPLIATLGMLGIVRGATLVMTQGLAPSGLPVAFKALGQTTLFGLQLPVYIMLFFLVIASILLSSTKFFRQYYFIGNNEKAAILSGIKSTKLKLIAYTISGGLAAFAGIIFTSRIGASVLSMGQGLELSIVAACIIGGCTLAGGEGSPLGSFLGVILTGIIINAFNLFGFSIYWQRIVSGAVLIIAVSADAIFVKRKRGF